MSFVRIYLVGYVLLLVGALLALWQAGVLARLPRAWITISLVIAIGFGLMLAVASSPRAVTHTHD
jgi:hypothetical protein